MFKIKTPFTAYFQEECIVVNPDKKYPVSKVILDPTCSLEQILLRSQYGMAIPQRDVSGDITNEELKVLGLSGNSLATMTRMEMIDLRMRAQMRINALNGQRQKLLEKEKELAIKRGAIDEYLTAQKQPSE